MSEKFTYTYARAHLSTLCDRVAEHREVVVISRRDAEDVALISRAELEGLLETAHLLRSPANAARLFRALDRVGKGGGRTSTPEELRRQLKLTDDDPA